MSYLGRSAKLSLKAQEKVSFLATAGQTSKTGLSYTPTFVEVYVNGVLLTDTTDFTATNGNSVTFTVALLLNDEVTIVSLKTFTVADHYNKTEADVLLAAKSPLASPVFTGNVGIGTSSPLYNVDVLASSAVSMIRTNDTTSPTLGLFVNSGSNGVGTISLDNGGHMTFDTGANGAGQQERLRIDSAGNVLVGHTAPEGDSSGTTLYAAGTAVHKVENNYALELRRYSSDGDIAVFRKDSTVVGSIQSRSGVASTIILDPRTNGVGLTAATARIHPTDGDGTQTDGVLDLGRGGNAFKDLYLSGGVYLGGTGAANKLDDYEEGTWTPVVIGGTQTATVMSCTYTKIGNLVTLNTYITLSNVTDTADLKIGGMPFNAYSYNATAVPQVGGNASSRPLVIRTEAAASYFFIFYQDTNTQYQITQAVLNGHFIFSMTYRVA